MCSQYELKLSLRDLAARTNSNINEPFNFESHIFPYKSAPIILREKNLNTIKSMNYSLIPAWSKTSRPRFSSYNARLDRPSLDQNQSNLELIYQAPAWRMPFRQQRCLVPITGFFESCRVGSHAGNIVKFSVHENKQQPTILIAAGIWDQWRNPITSEIIESFAILTDDPIDFIKEVGHDRQPVFLNSSNAAIWLNHQQLNSEQAYKFLKTTQQDINYEVSIHRQLKESTPQADLFSGF